MDYLLSWKSELLDEYSMKSYSQEGEDVLLSRVFNPQVNTLGFYIDVGAHHPKRFSNTYLFHKSGWKGMNIDATPGSMESFKKMRPSDINLELAISNSARELTFYCFNEPALNGFSKELTDFRENLGDAYYVSEELIIKTHKLSEVLESYMPEDVEIDFLTIDVEGLDFEVIQSNDWDKFRPKIVLVEILVDSAEKLFSNEMYLYLKDCDYEFFAKTVNTVFFRRKDFKIIRASN